MQVRTLSATSLIGDEVRNTTGEHLGEIEELMIDLHTGEVAYAVLSFGGILGIGDKLFAVPWGALALDLDDQKFVLDVDKQFLQNAPGFDKKDWPDFASPQFREKHYDYYEVKLASRSPRV